jgi:hypothetical protein
MNRREFIAFIGLGQIVLPAWAMNSSPIKGVGPVVWGWQVPNITFNDVPLIVNSLYLDMQYWAKQQEPIILMVGSRQVRGRWRGTLNEVRGAEPRNVLRVWNNLPHLAESISDDCGDYIVGLAKDGT